MGISDSGPPLLERFEVSDPDQLDYFFTDDDIVTAVFDRATDLGANEARRGRVDALLAFNIPPGADYSGQWLDDSTFVVTVTETLYPVPLLNHTQLTLRDDAPVRSDTEPLSPALPLFAVAISMLPLLPKMLSPLETVIPPPLPFPVLLPA